MSLQKVISPHSFQKMFTEPSLCAKPFLGFEDTALRGEKKNPHGTLITRDIQIRLTFVQWHSPGADSYTVENPCAA